MDNRVGRGAGSRAGVVLSALLFVAIAAASYPLLSSGGLVYRTFSLDFGPVALWFALGAALLVLSRVAAYACIVLGERPVSPSWEVGLDDGGDAVFGSADDEAGDDEQPAEPDLLPHPLLRPAAIAEGILQGLGGAALVAACLLLMAGIPGAIAARPDAPDLETLEKYLQVFGSLVKWVFVAGVFFAFTRVVKVMAPSFAPSLPFPWGAATTLAIAYLLLSSGGLLRNAFEFPGGLILAIIIAALALPYAAGILRGVIATATTERGTSVPRGGLKQPLPDRALLWTRVLLFLCDIGWIVLVLGIMLALPSLVDRVPAFQEGETLAAVAPYLDILDTLAIWSIVLLCPFIIIRVIAAFRPAVGEVFGFPMGRIILFALALVGFSDEGVPATASNFPIPQLMPAMAAALVISYLSLVLRRVALLGLPERIAVPVTNIPPLVGALMPAVSTALVVWALLQFSPLISAPLLDNNATESLGETSLPYFATLFDVRLTLSAFAFVLVLSLLLPNPLWSPAKLRIRPLLTATGFTASACLLWLSVAPLSGQGHFFPLIGAVAGAGLLTLALTQAAAYLTDFSDPLIANTGRWLAESRPRGFVMGAAFAFYGMLLRPLMYETLWFAAVYEWVVVLAIAVWAMFKMRGSLRTFVEDTGAAPARWPGWQRHEQRFEDHPDPRRELVARWQRRFVDSGDWTSLWTYFMGLLCHSNAPPERASAVIRPLREAAAPRSLSKRGDGRGFLRRSGDADTRRTRLQREREAGMDRSFRSAEQALASSTNLPPNIDASDLRETAGPYIENGDDPETMAAKVISAYRRRGADTSRVIALWFPMVNVVEQPRRWFEMPWQRRRTRLQAQSRRRRLVEGAISHLSGEGSVASLSVGLAARRAPLTQISNGSGPPGSSPPLSNPEPLDPTRAAVDVPDGQDENSNQSRFIRHQMQRAAAQAPAPPPSITGSSGAVIDAGQVFELLDETATSYYVRTSNNREGYVSKSALERLPILPGDEVNTV